MRIKLYDNLMEFKEDTFELLSRDEIQNNLMIGNTIRALKNNYDTTKWLLGTVMDDKQDIKLIFMMTHPFPILLYEVDDQECDEGLDCLIFHLFTNHLFVPAVLTKKELANRFLEKYLSVVPCEVKPGKSLRIYRLDEVKYKVNECSFLRQATEEDLFYLPYWNIAFMEECDTLGERDFDFVVNKMKNQIKNGFSYVYETTHPVSCASCGRETLHGVVISGVYTPPFYRGQGHATNMMALLSQKLLDNGYKFCALFTDLANPISNSIYQKVGYYPVLDYDEYFFEYHK